MGLSLELPWGSNGFPIGTLIGLPWVSYGTHRDFKCSHKTNGFIALHGSLMGLVRVCSAGP